MERENLSDFEEGIKYAKLFAGFEMRLRSLRNIQGCTTPGIFITILTNAEKNYRELVQLAEKHDYKTGKEILE